MKARIVLAAIAAIALAAVIVVYVYRDSLARQAANAVLRDSGLQITGISIGSIGASSVHFDRLVVRQRGGTEIHIRGVTLPLAAARTQTGTLSIDSIELVAADHDTSSAVDIAGIITAVLALPEMIPYPAVRISRLDYEAIRPLTDIEWQASSAGQLLRFRVAGFDVAAGIESTEVDAYRATLTASDDSNTTALALAIGLGRRADGYSVDGQTTAVVEPLLPVLRAYRMLPVEITRLQALLRGTVRTTIPMDPAQRFDIEATLKADGPISLAYAVESGTVADIAVTAHETVSTELSVPDLTWRTALPASNLLVSTGAVVGLPVSVTDLVCESGIHCSMRATIQAAPVSMGALSAGRLRIAGPATLDVGDATIVTIARNLSVSVGDAELGGTPVAHIELADFSGATVRIDDGGWTANAASAVLKLDGIEPLPGLSATLPVTLADVVVEQDGKSAAAGFQAKGSEVRLATGRVVPRVPDARGHLSYRDDAFSATGRLSMPDGSLTAEFGVRHNTIDNSGALTLRKFALDFTVRKAADFATPAFSAANAVAGTAGLELTSTWRLENDSYRIGADFAVSLDRVAGNYGDIAVAGVTTRLAGSYDDRDGLQIGPTTTHIDLVDAGIPVTDASLAWQASAEPIALAVSSFRASLLGGTLTADPFHFVTGTEPNRIALKLEHIQLPLMVKMANFESIVVEGSVSGELPVAIRDDKVSITEGRLTADPPGGVIRYLSGASAVANAQLGLATRALRNFQYDSLTSSVTYTEAGDLQLGMRLKGVNPDLDPTQPVVLNLNVEDNIPTLLKSLQAARSVEEILERRVRPD